MSRLPSGDAGNRDTLGPPTHGDGTGPIHEQRAATWAPLVLAGMGLGVASAPFVFLSKPRPDTLEFGLLFVALLVEWAAVIDALRVIGSRRHCSRRSVAIATVAICISMPVACVLTLFFGLLVFANV